MAPTVKKTLPILAIGFLTTTCLFGQKTEIHANAYSGLFTFRGNGAGHTYYRFLEPGSLYGHKSAFSYSFELQTQRVTRHRHLFGLAASFEQLQTKLKTFLLETDIIVGAAVPPPTKIKNTLSTSFLTLTPFIGQRFFHKAFTLDVIAGVDFANYLKNKVMVKTYATGNIDTYHYSRNDLAPSLDVRPRLQLNANYKQFSLLAGYSLGVTNYRKRADIRVYSNFLRLGVGYRIK